MSEDPRILELRQIRAKRQKAKGKLTAHERIQLLLYPGTFNEMETFITSPGDELGLVKEKCLGDGRQDFVGDCK